ncbi:isoaspartyl peptidase/L-asparaginase [Polyangium mundeleinium]|uniref:Isoaspartyl peptidase/L-asparaginase n=1 Tax=Polyangium mundeleinium TaxID=2995306 RepID=A0ABT5EUQ5_9BACT|nr:isoaspartyl peptidase/L-asparaginase [Polyangium mundeleinium]MDC0745553.1 isoaspartyl peptidase/L-asparaginase [Polyangium mundeleinium]
MKYAILTHGGAASPHVHSDGCVKAAESARSVLERGGDALEAALAATVILEDDPRFNAGTGSNLRFDGKTIEMDASVMTSDARFGAVACIQRVKNPILVAAKVMETPHLLIVGDGATQFARAHRFSDYDPLTEKAQGKHARAMAELRGQGDGDYAADAAPWHSIDWKSLWNFGEAPFQDTVGAVVRDSQGRFAATASTGGTVYMLKGRVGDSPLMGCGVYAGPAGAVAATGVGEEIVRRFLSKTVYDWLEEGIPAARAAQRGIAKFPEIVDVGLLVASRDGQAIASNRNMASALLVG